MTVIIAAANVANDEFTADRELARLLSMVSISYRVTHASVSNL
jgi:hypothetical protein